MKDRLIPSLIGKISKRALFHLSIVKPETLLKWQRQFIKNKWTFNNKKKGRPYIKKEIKDLILEMNYLWRPNLKDEKDNIFAELAFNSGSRYLITKNIRDFTIGNELILDSFEIITPSDFLYKWRKNHEKE